MMVVDAIRTRGMMVAIVLTCLIVAVVAVNSHLVRMSDRSELASVCCLSRWRVRHQHLVE